MPIFLHGLALQYYRGIGPNVQKLRPFKDFNFFIGANNAGKSTVLDFISKCLLAGPKRPVRMSPLEQYRGEKTGTPTAAVGVPVQTFIQNVYKRIGAKAENNNVKEAVPKISGLLADGDFIWIALPFGQFPGTSYLAGQPSATAFRKVLADHQLSNLWSSLTGAGGGGIEEHWIPQTLATLLNAQQESLTFPEVQLIPALRQIGPKSEKFADFSGRGLIDRLAEIQSPDHDKREERLIFDRINKFLQTVTGRVSAQIEVPHNREHILVHMDNKVLPLLSLGTGIHEVIMIAAFCTISENQIVCIEEPEIHLHPLLQRKLISYLKNKTVNQYFIATHSASFIDTPDAAIFHVSNDGVQTDIKESILRRERFAICVDLGTRASDIVQSNAVIWVEGPSDRVYVQHWIEAVAPELQEGIHYSIMFYGGRLLSHLSADDDDVKEFIGLRSLNQNLAILIDSDKSSQNDTLNQTKLRLLTEFKRGPSVAWITAGREIENYIHHGVLQEAVKTVHSEKYGRAGSGGIHDHSLYYRRKDDDKIEKIIDKVKVAKIVCRQPADLSKLDLHERIQDVANMIRQANV